MTSHHLYAPQHAFAPNSAPGLGLAGQTASSLNNFNTPPCAHQFPFQPQITSFNIKPVVDEEEIPEEKMHSPRTPYGSVPDPINNRRGQERSEATRFTYSNY